MRYTLIALGGALGSLARYALDGLVYRFAPATFPIGTFVVNLVGCFIFGLIVGLAGERVAVGSLGRSFWLIGLLGGFTTFSSFTFETFQLARDAQWTAAMLNSVGQVVLGLVALWTGYGLTRGL